MNSKALIEQRAELLDAADAIVRGTKNKALTRVEQAQFDNLMSRANTLSLEIRMAELEEARAAEAATKGTPVSGGLKSPRTRAAEKALGQEVARLIYQAAGQPYKALSSSTVGGVLQDPDVQTAVIEKLISYSPFAALGVDFRVADSNRNYARFPKVTGLPETTWPASEGTELTADTGYTWSYIDLDFKTLATKVVKMSFELMDDSEVSMEANIGRDIMMAIANEVTRRVFDGDGSTHPRGILQTSGILQIPAGGTNFPTIGTFDAIVDAIEGLLNRNVPLSNIGICTSPEGAAQLQKTLATDNDPLRYPSWVQQIVDAGRMQMTTGLQNNYPSGTGVPFIVGDFSNLMIRGKQVTVKLSERFAAALQYGFIGYSRWSWAVKRPDFAVITGITQQTTT